MSNENHPPIEQELNPLPAQPPEGPPSRSPPRRPRRRPRPVPSAPLYDTIESAAAKLGLDVEALRARCRRAALRVGDSIQAQLGGGIVAFKFGRSWRVRMPPL
jgi:hypothetical protein